MKKFVLLIILLLSISQIFADGAKYLIIAPDSFVQALQPLADWKTRKGVKAMIVPLSVTGNTAAQIKDYILHAYNNWEIRPEYILLAGRGTLIPSWSIGSVPTDDGYADMAGNYQIELGIGRFPATTVDQINNIVAKTLSYERTPFLVDTTWYRKGTIIVREDGVIANDSCYWNITRFTLEQMQNASYLHIDSFSRIRGDSARHVENAITDGRAYVAYLGQCVGNWWNPFSIDTAHINNGFKLPIVISIDLIINLSLGTSYLGENLLNAGSVTNPKGTVGIFGVSVTYSFNPTRITLKGIVTKGFFSSVFSDGMHRLGDAAKRAKFILDSIQPSGYNVNFYREWNLLGDPELNLWTAVPKTLTVTYDSIIPPTPTNVTVNVISNGIPIPNALICLMKDSTIYEYGYSDSNGTKVFSISPQDTGTISITVTARNCHPFEGIIRVLSAGVEEIGVAKGNCAMTLGVKVYPNPAKSVIRISYPFAVKEIKIFDVAGKLIKEIASVRNGQRNDKLVRISLEGIKSGVYFIQTGDERIIKKLVITK